MHEKARELVLAVVATALEVCSVRLRSVSQPAVLRPGSQNEEGTSATLKMTFKEHEKKKKKKSPPAFFFFKANQHSLGQFVTAAQQSESWLIP